jgi:hypothetical protein
VPVAEGEHQHRNSPDDADPRPEDEGRADRSAKREADLVRSGSKIDFHRLTLVSGETPIIWGETAAVKVEENHLGLIHQMKTERQVDAGIGSGHRATGDDKCRATVMLDGPLRRSLLAAASGHRCH